MLCDIKGPEESELFLAWVSKNNFKEEAWIWILRVAVCFDRI